MSYSLAFSKAVIMILFIADKVNQGMYDFVPTKLVSQALNIAAPTAVKILQSLTRSGLIETREGAKGGIRLALPADKVTVLDIFNAVEYNRPLFRDDFNLNVSGKKPTLGQESIATVMNNAEQAMKKELMKVTVLNLMEEINM